MKKTNIIRLILLVGLVISASGFAKAQGDSTAVVVHTIDIAGITTADLPALIADSIVGISIAHMNFLTDMKIDCDGVQKAFQVISTELDTAYVEIEKRDTQIFNFSELNRFQSLEIQGKDILVKSQDEYITLIEKQLKKQRRSTIFAWITGGVVSGLLGGLLITSL